MDAALVAVLSQLGNNLNWTLAQQKCSQGPLWCHKGGRSNKERGLNMLFYGDLKSSLDNQSTEAASLESWMNNKDLKMYMIWDL